MILAIIGSRKLYPNLDDYLPEFEIDEIVSGGAMGVDALAEKYAKDNNIPCTVFLPEYKRYGRPAPLIRNKLIIERADEVVAFWDGSSSGTMYSVKYARKLGKTVHLFCKASNGFNPVS